MNKIAVVILNYNGQHLLRKFLPGVIEFSREATIVVADNNSSDGSVEMMEAEFPGVRLIRISENLGFCGGYNTALEQVEANYFVLLNSDVEVTEKWLGPIIKLFDSDSSIAAAQPKILAYDNKAMFEYAGAGGGYLDALGYPFCRGRVFDSVEQDSGQYDDTRPVFWATGACLAVRASEFRRMGGFDTSFFAHMEEIDLCWKLNRAGLAVYYAGESIVYHVGGGTLSRQNPVKTYLNFRNGLFLITKNMPAADLAYKLPVRLGLDWLAMLVFLSQGSFRNAGAVLKAHAHFILGLQKCLEKRREFSALGYIPKKGKIYRRSVVLDYFVNGYKTYSQLHSRKIS